MKSIEQCTQLVTELGFTENEAAAYVYLLQYSPATGYKIAKGIGRSFSNTYKIMESLERKAAVLVDGGEHRVFRAVPIEELLDRIDKRFQTQRRKIVDSVQKLTLSDSDQRLYELKTIDQVYERCRRMLGESRERVLMELFPEPWENLRDDIRKTAKRGVNVSARIYEPDQIKGVNLIVSPYGLEPVKVRGTQWLAVYVDGLQYLQANLINGGEGVYHAIWSENKFLSRELYSYVNSDLHFYALQNCMKDAKSLDGLRKANERLLKDFPVGGDLGYQKLVQSFKTVQQKSGRKKGKKK